MPALLVREIIWVDAAPEVFHREEVVEQVTMESVAIAKDVATAVPVVVDMMRAFL